jgi:hypothetical protein
MYVYVRLSVSKMKRGRVPDGGVILSILTRPISEYLYPSEHKSIALTCKSVRDCIMEMYGKEITHSGCLISIEEPVQALGDWYTTTPLQLGTSLFPYIIDQRQWCRCLQPFINHKMKLSEAIAGSEARLRCNRIILNSTYSGLFAFKWESDYAQGEMTFPYGSNNEGIMTISAFYVPIPTTTQVPQQFMGFVRYNDTHRLVVAVPEYSQDRKMCVLRVLPCSNSENHLSSYKSIPVTPKGERITKLISTHDASPFRMKDYISYDFDDGAMLEIVLWEVEVQKN